MARVALLVAHMSKGGMQKCMSNFSLAMSGKVDHDILYFGTENPGFPFAGRQVDLNIEGSKTSSNRKRLLNFFKRCKKLRKHIQENHIDTVISYGEVANIVNVLVPKKRTILAVQVDLQRSFAPGWYGKMYRFLVTLLYRRADVVVAISESIARDLMETFHVPEHKVVSLCNIYDFEKVLEDSKVALTPDTEVLFKDPVVINIANLNQQKGQKHLINAFSRAKRAVPNLQLVIIGRGAQEQPLKKHVIDMGLESSVHFFGFQANPYKYLSRAKVFALTSLYEGIPTIVIEALLLGIPVISTDCKTGPREILEDSEYGILVPDITDNNAAEVEDIVGKHIISLVSEHQKHDHYAEMAKQRAKFYAPEKRLEEWLKIMDISQETGTSQTGTPG